MTRALHAEWTKLRTVSSTPWTVLSIVVCTVAIGTLTVMGLSADRCGEPGAACGTDTARFSLAGVYLGQIAVVVLAVLAVTPEYETLMIRSTLAAEPRRGRVLAAKTATVTAIALAAGVLAVLGSLAISWIILPGHGFPALSIGDGPTLRAYSGTVLYLGLIAVLSLGLAVAIRHTGATITVVLSLLYTLPIVATVVSDPVWRDRILRFSPMTAGLAIQSTRNLAAQPIQPWPGIGVLASYTTAAAALGWILFHRRDA